MFLNKYIIINEAKKQRVFNPRNMIKTVLLIATVNARIHEITLRIRDNQHWTRLMYVCRVERTAIRQKNITSKLGMRQYT